MPDKLEIKKKLGCVLNQVHHDSVRVGWKRRTHICGDGCLRAPSPTAVVRVAFPSFRPVVPGLHVERSSTTGPTELRKEEERFANEMF